MRHLERKDGFTLVELVVGIACAAMVMAAAAALLLMGARIQRTLRDEAKEQQTVRIVLTMLEDLASEGGFDCVVTTEGGWILQKGGSGSETAVITYENGELSGAGENNVLLDGLKVAHAELNGQLLTFTFETDQSSYESSVYCRLITPITTGTTGEKAAAGDIAPVKDLITNSTSVDGISPARFAFLQTLCAEYGSTGQIKGDTKYYSEWYADAKGLANISEWGAGVPWCACFLSWAAQGISDAPKFANVDDGVKNFQNGTYGRWITQAPTPGDYIFFDWEGGDTADPDHNDPDHVGAVLYVSGGLVYTIEGNSGGRVAIHSYSLNDPRIMGYGVLPWA